MTDEILIDREALNRIFKLGGDNLLRQIIAIFLDKVPQKIAAINTAVTQGVYKTVAFEAHALKSSSGNLGAVRMLALATKLEQKANENPGPELAPLAAELEHAAAATVAWLKSEYVKTTES